ncbi:hypothetical protein PIB30_099182 [Stylosanthes scabra]|uniref:Uncharacterized protein n=1 Tax=Stylosanthes scabra TaxID=79078 RepID=A0ABU6YUH3_9FABA|nr:hypothetical protein [Stylosanthes scabra]
MARTKQTGKRTRVDLDAPPAPPRLSQMPVESWFEEDDQRTAYQERLSRMEILVPKHLAADVLPEAEFQEFWRLIDQTGKRTRVDPDAPPPPPRLSQMPVESWFEEDDQRTRYQERLSKMEILVPKHLAADVLPEAEFQEFWRLIDV